MPPGRQDVERWAWPMIEEAARTLLVAARAGTPGRFQLEAAIQSAHAQRGRTGWTDWDAIALLYEGLVRIAPTVELSALLGAPGPPPGQARPDG